ncbi:Dihydrosphingosine phosphate lyase [Dispira simplex]|nr:Dihydrosphingosine phosphate lyase [Dispira simplex]
MAPTQSTSWTSWAISQFPWRRYAERVWKNPRRVFTDVTVGYLVVRYALRLVRRITVHGIQGTAFYTYRYVANWLVRSIRTLPGANATVQRQVDKAIADIEEQVAPTLPNEPSYRALPVTGRSEHDIMADLKRRNEMNTQWQEGKVSGTVYHGGEELNKLITEAFGLFTVSNPLHPDVFPGLRRMEAEVVSMVLGMYHAPTEAVGTTTSGGTESIIMAVRAHLVWAQHHRGVTDPEIVLPATAHAAFDKAAEYFGIRVIHIPIDAETKQVHIPSVQRAISGNTVMLVGSAPNFPHGIIDDIEALSQLATKHKVGLHVDCCLGGFLVPFMEQAGYPLPLFDFRLPGVTSISCDTHKYGFAPKGSSVVMYRNKALQHSQYFVAPDWPGGIYASPTIAGSRPGALIAGCWAAMMYMGEQSYVDSTRRIVSATRYVKEQIEAIPELRLIGDPLVSVVAFAAYVPVNIYGVNDELHARGWNLNVLQYPACLHFCFTLPSASMAEQFVRDLKEAVAKVKANPDQYEKGSAAIYGLATTVPDRSIVGDIARGYVDSLYKV